jgi:hypothetical protein
MPRPSPFGVVWRHAVRVMQDARAAVEDGTADPAQKRMVAASNAGLAAGRAAGGGHGSFRSVVH